LQKQIFSRGMFPAASDLPTFDFGILGRTLNQNFQQNSEGLKIVSKLLVAPLILTSSALAADTVSVSFHKDVLPILPKHRQTCHRPNQMAPRFLVPGRISGLFYWSMTMRAYAS
jgi:hypothetical protein